MAASAEKTEAEVRTLQDNIQAVDDRIERELNEIRLRLDACDKTTETKSVEDELQIKDLQERLQKLEAQWPIAGTTDRKGKWSLSCPKDMQPTCWNGKEDGWKKTTARQYTQA